VHTCSGSPDGSSAFPPGLDGGSGLRVTVYLSIVLTEDTVPGAVTRGGLADIQLAIADAARRMTASGHPVRYVNGMYMPARTRLLCVFRGESEEVVLATARLVGLPFAHIKAIADPGTAPPG
jgi:Protein of unknown function (DUF4242)